MRKFALAAATAVSLIAAATSAAEARHHHYYARHYANHQHYGRYLATRHWRYAHRTHLRRHYSAHVGRSALPGPCRVAASMGGPCGCWADHVLGVSGSLSHVWKGINLWLANDWRRFPHVAPEQANAAVWPGRHFAPIIPGTYHDGTVVVRDSWMTHRIRVAGLVLVRAPTRGAPKADIRGPLYRYTSAVPL
jgi:hypothetical protein